MLFCSLELVIFLLTWKYTLPYIPSNSQKAFAMAVQARELCRVLRSHLTTCFFSDEMADLLK